MSTLNNPLLLLLVSTWKLPVFITSSESGTNKFIYCFYFCSVSVRNQATPESSVGQRKRIILIKTIDQAVVKSFWFIMNQFYGRCQSSNPRQNNNNRQWKPVHKMRKINSFASLFLVLLFHICVAHGCSICNDSTKEENDTKPVDISDLLKSFEVRRLKDKESYFNLDCQVNYDRRVRPDYGGDPVSVGVTLYVLSVSEISEKFMDFTFDMYFRQFWKDSRLGFEIRVSKNN